MTPPSPPDDLQDWAKFLAQTAAVLAFLLKLVGI